MQHHLDKLLSKPLSWSCLASWEFSKDQWTRKYLLGIVDPPNPQAKFGNQVGERLAQDPSYLPAVERYDTFEPKLTGSIDGIPTVGYFDSLDLKTCNFYEYKTSGVKDKWTHKTANSHGQILFYLILIYQNFKKLPENIKIKLFYIPVISDGDFNLMVDEPGIKGFNVKHTTPEMIKFGKWVTKTYEEMKKYALELSTGDDLQ